MSAASGHRANSRVLGRLAGLVIAMGALSFAAVPLYDWFCRVTGYAGTTQASDEESDIVLARTITVRFDASTASDLPWSFEPVAREMEIRIGETGLAFYEATNHGSQPIAGTAAFNVAPFTAGLYFTKIACFCFERQVLLPGQTVRMPVSFYVDPELVEDAETESLREITLSYAFYRDDAPTDDELADAETTVETLN
ncbi:MAG: cytochrome c oxidase assembly protein [Pseudomonadota bacterium]